jgi:cytochrome o ubiquinol oxidase subunit 2
MNSFWIPQLAGQIYAMSGMNTQLHIVADQPGDYAGSSANISGSGFAGMRFTARASSEADFDEWVHMAQSSPDHLGWTAYSQLAEPSKDATVRYFSSPDPNLYGTILMKYMGHGGQ